MYRFKQLKGSPTLRQNLHIRATIIQSVRDFFIKRDLLEVETPNLVSSLIPESYLEYFTSTLFNRRKNKKKLYLTTSPESSLKKLLVAGIGNCFEITKSYRNTETDSTTHNPEFTILEWYRVNATYTDIMKDCQDLLLHIKNSLHKKYPSLFTPDQFLKYKNTTIDLTPPWTRLSVSEAFARYANIDLQKTLGLKEMRAKAREKEYTVDKKTWEELFNQILLNEIEPRLAIEKKPTILYDYPASEAALARKKPENPLFAERFEAYIGGLEIGDCYSELTDYPEQKERFKKEQLLRKVNKKTQIKSDEEFLQALKTGLPPCSGIAVGLDRLVMLFTGAHTIQDVLAFPQPD